MTNLPQPQFTIGQHVKKSAVTSFFRRQNLREAVRYWRKASSKRSPGRLYEHGKKQIRTVMSIIDNAHTIEIAGITPKYGHVTGYYPVNQCYVGGVRGAASPMSFGYTLLFRADVATEQGNSPQNALDSRGTGLSTLAILSLWTTLLDAKDVETT